MRFLREPRRIRFAFRGQVAVPLLREVLRVEGVGKEMTPPLSQKEKDSRRSSTFIRIEIALLNVIRRFAAKRNSTVKSEIEAVLRSAFKVKP